MQDVYGRYKQSQRHAYTAVDVAYSLKMLFEKKINLRAFVSAYFTLESFLLVINLTWVALYYIVRVNFWSDLNEFDSIVVKLMAIISINSFVSYSAYFYYKKRATVELYKLEH